MKLNIVSKNHPNSQADPFILKYNNEYYVYSTPCSDKNGVECFKSSSLDGEYEWVGEVFKINGEKGYWAPAVIQIDDKFYMYVSTMPENEDDVHLHSIKVAVSSSPMGPFEYLNELTSPFSIDPHPVLNSEGLFMFYSLNDYNSEKIGTKIVLDKMLSPTKVENNPKDVVAPSIKEEIFMKNRFNDGKDWHTIEGACYFNEGDYHYVLYSANCYQNEYYFVGYAVCESKENDLLKLDFKKYPDDKTYEPLLARNEFESGTGHNSVIKVDDEWYIIYHGRDLDDEEYLIDNRTMRIAKIKINKEKLFIERTK